MGAFPHPNVLEEPRTHDAGCMLGQNASLGLRCVFILTQKAEILVQLQLELRKHTYGNMDGVFIQYVCASLREQVHEMKVTVYTY